MGLWDSFTALQDKILPQEPLKLDPDSDFELLKSGLPPGILLSVVQNENQNRWSVKRVQHFNSSG